VSREVKRYRIPVGWREVPHDPEQSREQAVALIKAARSSARGTSLAARLIPVAEQGAVFGVLAGRVA
jgi:hypothetical protein